MKKLSMMLICMVALFAFVGCDDSDSTPKQTGPVSVTKEVKVTVTQTAEGLPATTVDSSAGTGTAATKVVAAIPAGTQVLKADGTRVTNPLTVKVVASDPESEATFEGGSFNYKDQNNAAGTFVSAGHFSVEISAGDQPIETITNPIQVTLTPKTSTFTEGEEAEVVAWASPLYRFSCKAKFVGGKFTILIVKGNNYGCSFLNNILQLIVKSFKFNIAFGKAKPAST